MLACKAYVRTSEDPLYGNDQKAAEFYERIHATYVRMCQDDIDSSIAASPGSERSTPTVVARHKKVRMACVKFESC